MQLTLIRHLPTEWNKKTWLQGRRDIEISPLTEEYQQGIIHNQQVLRNLAPFELVLASSLKRTHQTAMAYGFQPETEGLLDELDFGPFEGMSKQTLWDQYGDQWRNNPKDLILGERVGNLERRVVLFLEKYKNHSNVLAFGHGSWIRAMLSYVEYGDINFMNQRDLGNNACVTLTLP
ncbi:histidine phosphatase family protein [Neobacillus dielmonensis]|uniref:histidine phosphatase family protein n=1 Tax=Neobacillus dielmonensis TaxID=1347369 RepID=UPI0005A9B392|nr:histidine phosphatase family protein [Neobacillus dielmonensis]